MFYDQTQREEVGGVEAQLCLLSPVASLGWKMWSECERGFHEDRLWLPVAAPPSNIHGGWWVGGCDRLEALKETSGQKGC